MQDTPTNASPDARPLRERPAALAVLLALAVAVVFLPSLFGDFVWDDVTLIGTNVYVRDLSRIGDALTHDFWDFPSRAEAVGGLGRRYYRPVVTLAYALQFKVFGENAPGFHLVSLALHVACSLLAFGWLHRRIGATPRQVLPALMGAAIFALHPSRPESVSWISGSTDLWMTLWLLLGLRAWDRGAATPHLVRASICFALAALSKEAAIVVPALLALDLAVTAPPSPEERRARWRACGLVCVGTLAAVAARAAVLPLLPPRNSRELPSMLPERVAATVGHYAQMVAWPWNPSVQAGLQRSDPRGLPLYDARSVALGALVLVAVAAFAALAWRNARWRPYLGDLAWFFVALSPTLNLIPMGMTVLVADRFLYLPLLGLCALAARAAGSLEGPHAGLAASGVGLACAVAFGLVSSTHASHFTTEEALWTHEIQVNPCNHFALGQRATVALAQRDHGRVPRLLQASYRCAVANGAGDHAVQGVVRTVQFLVWTTPDRDRATLLAARGFLDAFVTQPSGTARLDAGELHMALELRPREAAMRRALRLDGDRAYAYVRTWEFTEAERQLRAIVATDARAYTARRYLALALAGQERWDDAIATASALARDTRGTPQSGASEGLAARLTATRDAARSASNDPVLAAVVRARGAIDLGLSERARQLLAPVRTDAPARWEPLEALCLAELEDQRYDVARALLAEAMTRFSGERGRWLALSARLPAQP